jgi:hypothetical protein
VTPAQHTRIVLAEFKGIGVPFNTAWANAMRMLPRKAPDYREWKVVLSWARPAFQAYYDDLVLGAVQVDAEHSLLAATHRADADAVAAVHDLDEGQLGKDAQPRRDHRRRAALAA